MIQEMEYVPLESMVSSKLSKETKYIDQKNGKGNVTASAPTIYSN